MNTEEKMIPKYSILYFNEELNKHIEGIKQYLYEGIKVFWLGSVEDKDRLSEAFSPFVREYFLQTFIINGFKDITEYDSVIITDGEGIQDQFRDFFYRLEANIEEFNAAQYRVEHCNSDSNIIVKASAGTGKTTVMVDRILYLMHTVSDLNMSEIFMITFTNEATNQMNRRLQSILLKKYSLTKNKRYLTWLEQQSQMHISTIDSLAYDLFKRFGTGVGYGRDLKIQPLEKERKDLFKDLVSDVLHDKSTIFSQIGMSYTEACNLLDKYWKELTRKGYTVGEILGKDWGVAEREPVVENYQKVMKIVLEGFEERYRQVKLDSNAISINDLFFDFGHYLLDERLDCGGLDMKYLFVDEFQDTDYTQIRTFARLVKGIGARLFAVGDVKQSIYAFKGATDEAFDFLDEEMKGELEYFSLLNNYRTCENLMRIMERYFFKWSEYGLLRYEEHVRPFNKNTGSVEMHLINKKDEFDEQTIKVINKALDELEQEVRSGRKKVTERTKVAVLVRGNKRAAEIADLCRKNGKTVVLNSDRYFYLSQAVRDFYAMISSHIFVEQPIYTYNYLMTPYSSYEGVLSVPELEICNGNNDKLNKKLAVYKQQTSWEYYHREFRLRPVLSVIKEMVEKENVIDRFISMDKVHMYGDNWTEAKQNRQAFIDAKSYQLNLDKLMEIIQQRMEGEFITLYDLYIFLSLMIATNREEMEPDIDMVDDYTSVYILTVHKSKGLEFDTVIMPAMNNNISPIEDTTILANKEKVAWYYKKTEAGHMQSEWYDELRKEVVSKGIAEETRLLYVAMTRAVEKLVLLVNNWSGYESWSSLIRKVGLINE